MVELSIVGDYCDAIFCICLMNVFENKFSDLICQIQQSAIVIASLRSTQTCGGRSSAVQVTMKVEWVVREEMVVHWVLSLKINFQTSSAKSNNLRL